MHGALHHHEVSEHDLFDLIGRLVLIGGGPEVFREIPEDRNGLVDGPREARLRGRGVGRELDGGNDGGEHGHGFCPMRCGTLPEAVQGVGMRLLGRAIATTWQESLKSVTR